MIYIMNNPTGELLHASFGWGKTKFVKVSYSNTFAWKNSMSDILILIYFFKALEKIRRKEYDRYDVKRKARHDSKVRRLL